LTTTQVRHAVNVVLPAAPPTRYWPDINGDVVAAGSSWELLIDTTGLPAGQLLAEVYVESFDGTNWNIDGGVDLQTGPQGKSGGNIASLDCTVSGTGRQATRLRIENTPGYTLPSVTLNKIT
jgi:hypothetical protein